jgi:acetylornithine deacetylase
MIPVVRELEPLIAFPTVSSRPITELAAHVAQRCEDVGFRVERFDDPRAAGKCSLIARRGPQTGDPGRGLVLSGHMDVVPTEGQPWDTDPFRLTERDGRLYGRGTADMKGFFAATFQALERLKNCAPEHEVVLIWTHDEEVGCRGSAALVEALTAAPVPMPSACLIGEPTEFRILRMHPGHVGVEIAVRGHAAHSSRPDLGINAIEDVADIVTQIRALAVELAGERADLPEMERPWVAVNIARVEGGSAINIVPDRCVLQLGYRPLPGQPPEAVLRRIEARIAALPLRGEVTIRLHSLTPSMLTPAGTPLEAALARHASHPGCGAASFGTDGANLARLGMQPLIFGPGSISVAHQPNEHVEVAALVHAVDVLEQVIRARCFVRGS